MIPRGPQFLDEDEGGAPWPAPASSKSRPDALTTGEPTLPRGPVLLEPEPDAPERLDLAWKPEVVVVPRRRLGAVSWVAAGLCTIVLAWIILSIASFFLLLLAQSIAVAMLGALVMIAGLLMIAYAAALELRAYRSLGTVEQLRADLASAETTVAVARRHGRAWLQQVQASIPDPASVDRTLENAETVAEVRAILRSQVADRLREAAQALGRRAAVEGATLVAICPHPAWDGVIAAGRGLFVIRQVAALYGLRPGFAVTLGLARRVAWTAAGTTGLTLVSQGLANHLLTSMPVLKHVAGVFPETGVVAARLHQFVGMTAETCCPVPD